MTKIIIPKAAIDAARDTMQSLHESYNIQSDWHTHLDRTVNAGLEAAAPHIILANQPVSQWQPIETCPKEGRFMFFASYEKHIETRQKEPAGSSHIEYDSVYGNVEYITVVENVIDGNIGVNFSLNRIIYTHWMNIPQPTKDT